jgi:hypothetical protein
MQGNTRYYWRVRGRNGNFTSAWATRWFETAPPTSLEDIREASIVQIFPNPAQSFFLVRTKGEFAVEVTDIAGKIVFEQANIMQEIELKTDGWKAGLYFVKVTQNDRQSVNKLWVRP